MAEIEDILDAIESVIGDGKNRGLAHSVADDTILDGRFISLAGNRMMNFGSCSYLGLETHPEMKKGIIQAVTRYGTQFSSSRTYLSAPGYMQAEPLLERLFGRPVLITSSTTMGHIATMPTIISSRDALILDHQVHHSVQVAAKLVRVQGTSVELLPHNDLARLGRRIAQLARNHRRVWYAADGLYSMYADFIPIHHLNDLIDQYECLSLYIDDAHSVSWMGPRGCGYALHHLTDIAKSRAIVVGSLNKSFAAAGGVVTFPHTHLKQRVYTVGGPMIFSGPVQPPMLGAIIASAQLHLCDAIAVQRQKLIANIEFFNVYARERGLPLLCPTVAPLRCIGVGLLPIAYDLNSCLQREGFYVNTATFPAVPVKRSGLRIALTAHHHEEDIAALVDAVAFRMPQSLARGGSTVAAVEKTFHKYLAHSISPLAMTVATDSSRVTPSFRLEHHTSIHMIRQSEWDGLLGDRGCFGWEALRSLEEAFGYQPDDDLTTQLSLTPNQWVFHYWIVRDMAGDPVVATVFTLAVWKDDMLSRPEVSAEVEKRRKEDPYFLTSTVLAMGTLVTDGDHLYIDRTKNWTPALRLIIDAARAEEDKVGASTIVFRDIADSQDDLHEYLVSEGFTRIPLLKTWNRDIDFEDDQGFLAQRKSKARQFYRKVVLNREGEYQIRVVRGGSESATSMEPRFLDHLYSLYRRVHARSLALNVFPLPRKLFDVFLAHSCWEFIILTLVDGPPDPVAFVVQHVASTHIQPLFVGLDYSYVASHGSYQQILWQSLRSARRHGVGRVLLGMGAESHKARLGATCVQNWMYLQPTISYHGDVLARMTEDTMNDHQSKDGGTVS